MMVIGIGAVALAGMLVSFTGNNDDEKKKRYQIIHQENGEVVEYDTLIPMSSTYSVDDFLADKGIKSENVEIIDVPSMAGHRMMFTEEHSEFMHDMGMDGEQKEVKIMVEVDDEGNMTTTKTVNGEEVEMTEDELEELKMHKEDQMHGKHGEHIMIKEFKHDINVEIDGEGEEVKIIVEMDDYGNMTTQKFVNGEEVEMTEEERENMKMHKEMSDDHVIIRIDSDEPGEEELEKVMKELKIELKELDGELEEMEIEIDEMFGEGENVFILENGVHHAWTSKGEGEDFTLVLVTKDIDPSDESMRSQVKIDRVEESQDVSIYPNPSDGVFTIQLNQNEKVKTLIKITDAQGKVVFKDNLGKFSGEYREEVDLKKYGAGTYIINIDQGGNATTEKIVVK